MAAGCPSARQPSYDDRQGTQRDKLEYIYLHRRRRFPGKSPAVQRPRDHPGRHRSVRVREETIQRVKIVEFKYAQGAKPGLGGHLLGEKNTESVAKMREAVKGTSLFSPFPFHSVYSIEDHKKHIDWIKEINPMPWSRSGFHSQRCGHGSRGFLLCRRAHHPH